VIEISEGIYVSDDLPVVYFRPLDAVVMSDIHIGFEEEMARKGIFLPRVQKKRFLSVYRKAREIFNFKTLIINGDLKHIYERLGTQERMELTEIFTQLKEEGMEVKVIKGNHDTYISLVTDKFDNVELLEELTHSGVTFTHGHKEVDLNSANTVVIGHEHPRISLRDRIGYARRMQCFLVVPLSASGKRVVALPSIGSYQSGNDISLSHANFMSPIMRKLAVLERTKPYIIVEGQGILEFPELGVIKDLLA